MRQIIDVIDTILPIITDYEPLTKALTALRCTALCATPEQHGHLWRIGSKLLAQELGAPDTPEKIKIQQLWIG